MKKKILSGSLAILALFSTSFAADGGKKQSAETTKEIAIPGKFETILVGPDINLVLVSAGSATTMSISGSKKLVDQITIKVSDNEMTISKKKNIRGNNITVYVPVTDLEFLELKSGASVSGEGQLRFTGLTIRANIGSHINLKAIGNIELQSADDCELVYEKYENSRLVSKAP